MRIRQSHLAGLSLEQRVINIEMFARLLGAGLGLSLVGILSFVFWLGSVSAKVSASSETINRVYGAVAENKDSLLVRTGVIEHRLTNLETKLDEVETRLEARLEKVVARLDTIEARLASMDSKLNKLISLQSRTSNVPSLAGPQVPMFSEVGTHSVKMKTSVGGPLRRRP